MRQLIGDAAYAGAGAISEPDWYQGMENYQDNLKYG